MDMGRIVQDALRIWREAPVCDLDRASRAAVSGDGAAFPAHGGGWPLAGDKVRSGDGGDNLLLLGDNLALMAALARRIEEGLRAPISLVYMDPPYFSNRKLESRIKVKTESGEVFVKEPAFSDIWGKSSRVRSGNETRQDPMEAYLAMLTPRIIAARELLAENGVMWLHLDRRAVHYAKVLADLVFGGADFLVNEVVWAYKSGGSSSRRFSNKHDTLLFYAKNKKKYKFFPQEEKSYNRALKPYRFKGVKEYRDAYGWYTMVNMKDVWEIPMVGRTAAERTGYATQKPEALLERIVLACTEPGDTCLDPFGGSGTLAAVCARLGRKWISIDQNPMAVEIAAKRLGRYRP